MDRYTMTNLEILWKLLVYHNKPMHFKVLSNYLIQFMSKEEIYKTIRVGLTIAIIDRTERNQLILSNTSVLRGKDYTLLINPTLNDIQQVQAINAQTTTGPISGIVILSHKYGYTALKHRDLVNYNYKNMCHSVGHIKNVLKQLEPIELESSIHGYPFDPFLDSFSKEKKNLTDPLVLFEHKINTNYSKYFIIKDSKVFFLPENNFEILDSIKLLTQLEFPKKFIYNRQQSILRCEFCTVPFFIERILSLAHSMKCGELSTDRKYYLSFDELSLLNKIVFENKLNITYE